MLLEMAVLPQVRVRTTTPRAPLPQCAARPTHIFRKRRTPLSGLWRLAGQLPDQPLHPAGKFGTLAKKPHLFAAPGTSPKVGNSGCTRKRYTATLRRPHAGAGDHHGRRTHRGLHAPHPCQPWLPPTITKRSSTSGRAARCAEPPDRFDVRLPPGSDVSSNKLVRT